MQRLEDLEADLSNIGYSEASEKLKDNSKYRIFIQDFLVFLILVFCTGT